ncbi:hypothetical protein LK03_10535 [Pseudomonas cremoricolorata]|uniref:DUF6875 domain-containing protein n=2 Tax=Pseudomonas cremoricolorata TaxID=157783 RepID=A0A089WT68_9PSED|nr:hypothetical protein LK03_10535 [Pseudomonas cremoricolorata]
MMERDNTSATQLTLVPIAQALQGPGEHCSTQMTQIAQWSHAYLCNPHPELGRSGAVCPWTPAAIKRETFWLVDIAFAEREQAAICADLLSLISRFKGNAPQQGNASQFKTIVAVLHGLDDPAQVNHYHELLKPQFLAAGLMLGEFYSHCPKPGLRSDTFNPLRSPVPLLVVREMVELDIAFLADQPQFVEAYLRTHGARAKVGINSVLHQEDRLTLSDAQWQVLRRIVNS